jgi:hypothetical protein
VTFAGLKRCGKSCRLRWVNYLRPDIKRGNISPDEEELIFRLHRLLGNRYVEKYANRVVIFFPLLGFGGSTGYISNLQEIQIDFRAKSKRRFCKAWN